MLRRTAFILAAAALFAVGAAPVEAANRVGGRAFTDTNDFGEAFARVQRDMSAYYLLGVEPAEVAAARPADGDGGGSSTLPDGIGGRREGDPDVQRT